MSEQNQNQPTQKQGRAKYCVTTKGDNSHFVLKAGNGEKIISGKTPSTLNDCRADIKHLQRYGGCRENYQIMESANKQWYFNFVSPQDNDIKGTSETYPKRSGAEEAIQAVMKIAATDRQEFATK